VRSRDEIMREWERRAAHYEEQRDPYSEGWKDALDWAMREVEMAKVYLKRVTEHETAECCDMRCDDCYFDDRPYCPRDEQGNLKCVPNGIFRRATAREIAAYLKRHPEAR